MTTRRCSLGSPGKTDIVGVCRIYPPTHEESPPGRLHFLEGDPYKPPCATLTGCWKDPKDVWIMCRVYHQRPPFLRLLHVTGGCLNCISSVKELEERIKKILLVGAFFSWMISFHPPFMEWIRCLAGYIYNYMRFNHPHSFPTFVGGDNSSWAAMTSV